MLKQGSNLFWTLPSIMAIFKPVDLLLFIDVAIIIFFVSFFPRPSHNIKSFPCFSIALISGLFLFSAKPIICWFKGKPILSPYDANYSVIYYNIVGYHILDFIDALFNRRHANLSNETKKEIETWFKKNYFFNPENSSCKSEVSIQKRAPNIIFIQMESLANFVLHRSFDDTEITPHLNAFADSSLYFTCCQSQIKAGSTSDAEFITLTSLFPVSEGSVFFRFPDNEYPALPKVLKKKGYETFAFHFNNGSFWNRNKMYPRMGIDNFYDAHRLVEDSLYLKGNQDASLFQQGISILKNANKPYFALFVTIESHLGKDWFAKDLVDYVKSTRKIDQEFGLFLNQLKKAGMYENTVLVVYGDHLPFLDFDNIVLKNPSLKWIYPKGRNVPLIIHCPSIQPRAINIYCGQIDIYPTIAAIMGFSNDFKNVFQGRNVLCSNNDYTLQFWPQYKLLCRKDKCEDSLFRKWVLQAPAISNIVILGNYFKTFSAP
jgi:uncharacterized sulfatase